MQQLRLSDKPGVSSGDADVIVDSILFYELMSHNGSIMM
jgi:hypothetical protein